MNRLLLTLLLIAFVPLANADYASCILENMKGVGSDVAAEEIKEACRSKLGQNLPTLEQRTETSAQSGSEQDPVSPSDKPAEFSTEGYLAKFKAAHETAYAFSKVASKTDAIKAVELTLSTFAKDLPETEEDDALADSLIELLKELNYNWLKSDFPDSFEGENYFFGYCAASSLNTDEESSETRCAHRPLVREQFCEPPEAPTIRRSLAHPTFLQREYLLSGSTAFPKKDLMLLKYKIEFIRSRGYAFLVDLNEPIKRNRFDSVCY